MNIIRTSQYAFDYLNSHRHGAVHSVYKKTINLNVDEQILAVQVSGSPLSPLSLITDQTSENLDALGIQPGDTVFITAWSRKLLIGTHCFHWDIPEVADLRLKILHPTLSNTVLELLKTYPPVGFVPLFVDTPTPLTDTTAPQTDAPDPFLIQAETILRTAAPITDLMGLGIGLTPSGDDFLCGVLAGLILIGKQDSEDFHHLSAEISQNLGKTNAISAAFLRCAMEGQFSEAIVTLGSVPFSQSQQMFHAIGHSSGADTLCGLYFAFGKFA